jgi:hypothetical protein
VYRGALLAVAVRTAEDGHDVRCRRLHRAGRRQRRGVLLKRRGEPDDVRGEPQDLLGEVGDELGRPPVQADGRVQLRSAERRLGGELGHPPLRYAVQGGGEDPVADAGEVRLQ